MIRDLLFHIPPISVWFRWHHILSCQQIFVICTCHTNTTSSLLLLAGVSPFFRMLLRVCRVGRMILHVIVNLAGGLFVVFNFGYHQGYTSRCTDSYCYEGKKMAGLWGAVRSPSSITPTETCMTWRLQSTDMWHEWVWNICTNVPEGLVFNFGLVFEQR